MEKQRKHSTKAHQFRSVPVFLSFLAVCVIPFVLAQRNSATESRRIANAPWPSPKRTLTFAERVAYQRAIEEVYWRHRSWPKERPDPKPSFDVIMSRAQLEKKVADYLRNSQALEDNWQRPLTAEQLQAEMDRMAKHTRQREVLQELFEALGDDPFVVAECLARPALAERLLTSWCAYDRRIHGDQRQSAEADLHALRTVEEMKQLSGKYSEIELVKPRVLTNSYTLPAIGGGECVDDTWTATSGPPDARDSHTSIWTGSEMIVWGGSANQITLNTGAKYNPSTDIWTVMSAANSPSARSHHTVVWSGSEMIVWGGQDENFVPLNTGGRYNPSTDTWSPISDTNAPTARSGHTAVWAGNDMIVWGGGDGSDYFNSGGRYNPNLDSWTNTSTTNAPDARTNHTAVSTGDEMIVWGGIDAVNWFNTGGSYNPATDSWTANSTTNAPVGRERPAVK